MTAIPGRDGATPSWTDFCGQWRKISLIWWKASLGLDSGWLAGFFHATLLLLPNGFSLDTSKTSELQTHTVDEVLPLWEGRRSHLWLHCQKFKDSKKSWAAHTAIKWDYTVDFCQVEIDVLCCPREWTLIGTFILCGKEANDPWLGTMGTGHGAFCLQFVTFWHPGVWESSTTYSPGLPLQQGVKFRC